MKTDEKKGAKYINNVKRRNILERKKIKNQNSKADVIRKLLNYQ